MDRCMKDQKDEWMEGCMHRQMRERMTESERDRQTDRKKTWDKEGQREEMGRFV